MAETVKKATELVQAAVIGGSGVYALEGLKEINKVNVETPFGKPSDEITVFRHEKNGKSLDIAFLPRHGRGHFIPPSALPQRANIAALKMLGASEILAFSAVGSLREEIAPGHFVLPEQIIDRTRHREDTFFDRSIVGHVSFGDPFDKALTDMAVESLKRLGIEYHTEKTLICMEGPAFSTRAESRLYRSWGGDIINMTAIPEAKLARELEIAYSMICMSTDYDSWRDTEGAVEAGEIMKVVRSNSEKAMKLVADVLDLWVESHPLESEAKTALQFGLITAEEKRQPADREAMNRIMPGRF